MLRVLRSPWWHGDRGSATAETAIVLPVVVVMMVAILVTGTGIGTQVQLENAARGAARELARGEDAAAATAAAQEIGGPGTRVSIRVEGDWVHVEVTRSLQLDAGILSGARWELSADASARREPHLLEGVSP